MKKGFLLVFLLGIIAVAYLVFSGKGLKQDQNIPAKASMVISKQTPQKEITIDSVTMPANGWVIARAVDGNRLSQIIEISEFLSKGDHTQIVIPLGDFYNGEELIGMIYVDNGDTIFNDNDQPYKSIDGNMIAVYVKTGEPVPASMMQPEISAGHMMGGNMVTVKYTNSGFVPARMEVAVGTMVEFVNESDKEMWVASNDHPGHEILPTFDQFKTIGKGGKYTYVFDRVGNWQYHDHINPELIGTVEVH